MEISRLLGGAFLLLGTGGAVFVYAGFGDVVSSFPVPSRTGTGGLAWDGTCLWFSGNGINYLIRTTTRGSVVSSFDAGTPYSRKGLTYDGTYLWFSDELPREPLTYYRVTTTGSRVGVISGWPFGDAGLAWEPGYLWGGPAKFTTNGSIVSSFTPPFYLNSDLAWYGHYLWNGGPNQRVYKISTAGSVLASFPVPGGAAAGGMTFDGKYLWLVNPTAGYVYQVDIDVVGMNPASMGKIKGLYR